MNKTTSTVASVPFMATRDQKQQLVNLGYKKKAEIDKMTPQQIQDTLKLHDLGHSKADIAAMTDDQIHAILNPPQSDQGAPVDVDLEMPTADELFGWAREAPEPEHVSPDSIAWDLADQECARLMAEAMRQAEAKAESDDAPLFSGFYGSLQELHNKETEPADYVLTGVRRRQVTLFLSVTNVGKSTILLNHCLAAAAGVRWAPLLPEAPARPLKILYFDGESTDDELKQDTLTMLKAIGGKNEALINFVPIVEPAIKGESLDLSNKQHFEFVKKLIAQHQPDIVVIDTIGSLFTLFNENDNAEVKRKVIRPLKALAAAGNCAVVGSHHIGKRGENTSDEEEAYLGRGASAFGTDTRAVFTLKREKSLGEGYVRLTLGKAKGVKFDPVNLRLDFDRRTFEILAAAPKVETPYQKVVNLFNGKPLQTKDIKSRLSSLGSRTIDKALKQAVENGDLFKIEDGLYQKKSDHEPAKNPTSHTSHLPIGNAKYAKSTQPVENVEDSDNSLDWPKNDECEVSDGGFWDAGDDENRYLDAIAE
jgi:hypothetical protein